MQNMNDYADAEKLGAAREKGPTPNQMGGNAFVERGCERLGVVRTPNQLLTNS
jgi:hypothetical protein